MNEHVHFASLAAASVDFTLAPAEQAELDRHQADCAACQSLVEAYRADTYALRQVAFVHAPDRVWTAVSGALSRPAPRRFRWDVLLAAALVGAALLGALLIVGARPPNLLADASLAPTTALAATSEPTATPSLEATASPAPGASFETSAPLPTDSAGVASVQLPIGLRAMVMADRLRIRSKPGVDAASRKIAVLDPGTTFTLVEGPVLASGYWWYRVDDISVSLGGGVTDGWVASADHDGTAWIGPTPKSCEGWTFAEEAITVRSLTELQVGIVGTWMGCVTTPWIPPQWVTLTFRSDGTYASKAIPHPAGHRSPAFYYGSDGDSPTRRYWLTDLQDSLNGIGEIDIVFDDGSGSIVHDELRNIKLTGDRLDFEFFHLHQYGPVTFSLYRIVTS